MGMKGEKSNEAGVSGESGSEVWGKAKWERRKTYQGLPNKKLCAIWHPGKEGGSARFLCNQLTPNCL